MTGAEWRATLALSFVSVLRMLGMFMILPVFAPYAAQLPGGATPLQAGLAIALFGLVQAVLQIPFGIASDRYGRRRVVLGGMALFALGSFVAGAASDIHWIMAGRAVQGMGAVSAAVAAWLSDVTRDTVRTQAMAIHGGGIGASFVLALVLGPVLAGLIGVDGIFVATGFLALLTVPVLLRIGDDGQPPSAPASHDLSPALHSPALLRLDGGVFLLNAVMTTMFAAAPFAIADTLGLPNAEHWKFYLPVLAGAVLLVLPLLRRSRQRTVGRLPFLCAIALLGTSMALAAAMHAAGVALVAGFVMFFVAFAWLQSVMPAMASRLAGARQRGAALGIFNTAQVLGAALGNLLGGYARSHWGLAGAFAAAAALPLLWLCFAAAAPAEDH